jgi:hypothetical protein
MGRMLRSVEVPLRRVLPVPRLGFKSFRSTFCGVSAPVHDEVENTVCGAPFVYSAVFVCGDVCAWALRGSARDGAAARTLGHAEYAAHQFIYAREICGGAADRTGVVQHSGILRGTGLQQ